MAQSLALRDGYLSLVLRDGYLSLVLRDGYLSLVLRDLLLSSRHQDKYFYFLGSVALGARLVVAN